MSKASISVSILFTCVDYFTRYALCIIHIGDKLIADDDDKQQLLNYMIQVCRPKDWQISLLEDRITERQLAISSSHSQKKLDNVLKGGIQLFA